MVHHQKFMRLASLVMGRLNYLITTSSVNIVWYFSWSLITAIKEKYLSLNTVPSVKHSENKLWDLKRKIEENKFSSHWDSKQGPQGLSTNCAILTIAKISKLLLQLDLSPVGWRQNLRLSSFSPLSKVKIWTHASRAQSSQMVSFPSTFQSPNETF